MSSFSNEGLARAISPTALFAFVLFHVALGVMVDVALCITIFSRLQIVGLAAALCAGLLAFRRTIGAAAV